MSGTMSSAVGRTVHSAVCSDLDGGKRQELNAGHRWLAYNSMCSRSPAHIHSQTLEISSISSFTFVAHKSRLQKMALAKQWQTRQIKDMQELHRECERKVRDAPVDWLSSKFLINISTLRKNLLILYLKNNLIRHKFQWKFAIYLKFVLFFEFYIYLGLIKAFFWVT